MVPELIQRDRVYRFERREKVAQTTVGNHRHDYIHLGRPNFETTSHAPKTGLLAVNTTSDRATSRHPKTQTRPV